MKARAIALTYVCCMGLCAETARAEFAPGDILLNRFSNSGPAGNSIQQYSPSGVLKQTFTGTKKAWEGVALTPEGNLVTTYRNDSTGESGVHIFNPAGTQIQSFSTSSTISFPADIGVFPSGNLAISSQLDNVHVYGQDGTYIDTIVLPSSSTAVGSYMQPNGTLWVTDFIANRLYAVLENGTVLLNETLSFSPNDLVVTTDSIWVTDQYHPIIHQLDLFGVEQASFTTPVLDGSSSKSIAIAPDGTLWTTSTVATSIYHYSTTGELLGSIPVAGDGFPLYLMIVPAPEPNSIVLATWALIAAIGWQFRWRS